VCCDRLQTLVDPVALASTGGRVAPPAAGGASPHRGVGDARVIQSGLRAVVLRPRVAGMIAHMGSLNAVRVWGQRQGEAYRGDQPRPLAGYIAAMSVYTAGVLAAVGLARGSGKHAPSAFSLWEAVVLGVATHKASRLLSKAAVTSPLRAPFVRYVGPSGDAELAEEVREDVGARHAVGELTTCPFCMGQWVATVLVSGRVLAPAATRVASATLVAVAMSDWLHLGYAVMQRLAAEQASAPAT
jgi:hypothetical protein